MNRRYIVAIVLAFSLSIGSIAVVYAAFPPGRCSCESMGYGVWDWEYWLYDCWTTRPPECDWT